jgi:hypothetical protein
MIFNTLFSKKTNPFQGVSEVNKELASFYENFIIDHYEDEAFGVLVGMKGELKKNGIRQNCFDLEIDLHNDGGENRTLCSATYQVRIDSDLSTSLRDKVRSIFQHQIELIPETTDLIEPFLNLIQYDFEDDREVAVSDTVSADIGT